MLEDVSTDGPQGSSLFLKDFFLPHGASLSITSQACWLSGLELEGHGSRTEYAREVGRPQKCVQAPVITIEQEICTHTHMYTTRVHMHAQAHIYKHTQHTKAQAHMWANTYTYTHTHNGHSKL